MKYFPGFTLALLLAVFTLGVLGNGVVAAGGNPEMAGWEKDSQYNRLYRVDKYTKIKGSLLEFIEVIPMPGMSPGLGMLIQLRNGEKATVHLGPKGFAHMLTQGFDKGDRIKVKGCWAELGGKKIFMASKIRNAEYFEMKFRRTRDGIPYWTLTQEEMIREKLED
jgi:hypothetical protein